MKELNKLWGKGGMLVWHSNPYFGVSHMSVVTVAFQHPPSNHAPELFQL